MFDWNGDRRMLLSTLWIFMTVNYIFCDVFTLHDADSLQQLLTGEAGGMVISEEFLLMFAAIMQIPMIMIVLSRVLAYGPNRYLNIIAALITGSIQTWTLTMGGSLHYIFFSAFEISTALLIIYLSLRWPRTSVA